jgi:hypothetical protein
MSADVRARKGTRDSENSTTGRAMFEPNELPGVDEGLAEMIANELATRDKSASPSSN